MLKRLARFDRLIAESGARITEQVLLIAQLEAEGWDATEARRSLTAFEGILVEYMRARQTTEELRKRLEGAPKTARPYTHKPSL